MVFVNVESRVLELIPFPLEKVRAGHIVVSYWNRHPSAGNDFFYLGYTKQNEFFSGANNWVCDKVVKASLVQGIAGLESAGVPEVSYMVTNEHEGLNAYQYLTSSGGSLYLVVSIDGVYM